MNPYLHSKISVKKRGGKISDYYPIHSFLDSTKELCSDNRHRFLHNLWGVRRVIIPIFGHTISNSDDKEVNIKDLCEQDHILPDYSNRFIPTIEDFVEQIDDLTDRESAKLNEIHANYHFTSEELNLLLSPLSISGLKKSLLITHNSWFIKEILPKVVQRQPTLEDFPIPTKMLFEKMNFASWMDNGVNGLPKSSKKIANLL
ncbi:MAG: hypothetical protein AB8G22_13450 [Saprospiraceae bacterium]